MKTEKNRKLKGSVLLTVVSVMALLIIFLTSALVLATAANRRAHRDYSSQQAEYTARAAIDSMISAINQDDSVRAAVQEMSAPIYANVQLGGDSLGRLVRVDSSGNDVWDQISIEPVVDPNTGNPKKIYYYYDNGVTTKWDAFNEIKITATVKVGKERKTVSVYAATTPSSIVTPQTPSNIQGLQTAGGAGFTTTAGVITGALNMGLMDSAHGDYTIYNDTVLHEVENFVNGSLYSHGGGIYIDVISPDSRTTILGDLELDNHGKITIDYTPVSAPTKQQDVPYLFVEGCLKRPAGQALDMYVGANNADANSHAPFNVFVGTVDVGQMYLSGDLYIMDENGTNYMGNDWACKLYDWTDSMSGSGAQFTSSGGNIYCRGDMTVDGGININGDFRVAKTLIFNGTRSHAMSVTGRVIADNVVIQNDGNGNIRNLEIYCNHYEITNSKNDDPDNNTSGDVTSAASIYGNNFYPLADSGITADEIYPSTMTKEEIYGHQVGDDWSISSDPAAPNYSENKIIKNLVELRNALHYDATNGIFDETVYLNKLSTDQQNAIADDSNHPVKWSTLGNPTNINHTSCQSAFDKRVFVFDESITAPVNITVDATDNIVFVFEDGVEIKYPIIIDAPSDKEVPIFINGFVTINADNQGCIITKEIYDRVNGGTRAIYEWDTINITLYAAKTGARLHFYNGGLISANAMAPTLSVTGTASDPGINGFKNLSYYLGTASSNTQYITTDNKSTFSPNWIGNAFIGGIDGIADPYNPGNEIFFNNFTLLYTRNGNNGGNPPPGTGGTVPAYYQRYFAEY